MLFLSLAALCGLAETVRTLTVNHVAHQGRRPVDVTAAAVIIAVPVVWVAALTHGLISGWQWTAAATAAAAGSAAVNAVMQPLIAWAVRTGGVGRATSWLGASPALLALIGPFVGDTAATRWGWVGCAAVAAGVVVCNTGTSPAAGRAAAATAAACAATLLGCAAVLIERAGLSGVTPTLFTAVLLTVMAPGIVALGRHPGRAANGAERRPRHRGEVRELLATPMVVAAGLCFAVVAMAGIGAVALGPAWIVLSLKRLSLPLGTLGGQLLDRRHGRAVETGRVLAGAVIAAAGVVIIGAAG